MRWPRAGSIVPTLGGNESEFQAQWKRAVFTPSMYMLDDLADVGAATGAAAGPAAKALPIITFHLPMRSAAAVVPNGVCAAWL
jgi:hypothetical protein